MKHTEKEAVMKRTRRIAGMITVALVMASFLVIGCGDSPNGPLVAGDDDGVVVKPGSTGSNGDTSRDGIKGDNTQN